MPIVSVICPELYNQVTESDPSTEKEIKLLKEYIDNELNNGRLPDMNWHPDIKKEVER